LTSDLCPETIADVLLQPIMKARVGNERQIVSGGARDEVKFLLSPGVKVIELELPRRIQVQPGNQGAELADSRFVAWPD
jgi:hypothetical protein